MNNNSTTQKTSHFESLPAAKDDPIFKLNSLYSDDPRKKKVNLGIGIYKTEEQKSLLLSSVSKAELKIATRSNPKNYLPISGAKKYVGLLLELVFGKDLYESNNDSLIGIHAPGGTGALRLSGELLVQLNHKKIYISSPNWPNHAPIYKKSGLQVKEYPYYDHKSFSLCFKKTCDFFSNLESGSAVLLQASCHNPTGIDFSQEEWRTILTIVKEKKLFPVFDFAYHGFKQNLDEDSFPIRLSTEMKLEFLMAYSCSKNFGLYNDRVGLLALKSSDKFMAKKALGTLKNIIRPLYSNPPYHGACIVEEILSDPDLRSEWIKELASMRDRIVEMRKHLAAGLQAQVKNGDYTFLKKGSGMFSLLGLNQDQVLQIRHESGLYMLDNSRINIAGLNQSNVGFVAESISSVIE